MLQLLERAINWVKGKDATPPTRILSFGPIEVQTLGDLPIDYIVHADVTTNLKFAEESGVQPLTMKNIFDQIDHSLLPNIIFFDTPPESGGLLFGNHWRLIDKNEKTATIQLCENLGWQDFFLIPQIELPVDIPFFTGIQVLSYINNGEPISLEEVVGLYSYQEDSVNIKLNKITVYWSDSEGKLQKVNIPSSPQAPA